MKYVLAAFAAAIFIAIFAPEWIPPIKATILGALAAWGVQLP